MRVRQVQEPVRQLQPDRLVHPRPILVIRLPGVVVQAVLHQLHSQCETPFASQTLFCARCSNPMNVVVCLGSEGRKGYSIVRRKK